MLSPDIIKCIGNSIDAQLPTRDQGVADSLRRCTDEYSQGGGFHASTMILEGRARIGADELAERAEIIWAVIQRCHRQFGMPVDERLARDLEQQIREHLARQAYIVLGMVETVGPSALTGQWKDVIPDAVRKRHEELFKRFSGEAHRYAGLTVRKPE